jgi:hypothetical protein
MADNSRANLVRGCVAAATAITMSACALPMNDNLGKQAYEKWAGTLPDESSGIARDTLIFRLKAVKDYEYHNYVLNLRRGVGWGEVGSDSVKIILDSLVAVTGTASTKAALGAASAGVTGATTSIKKNVLFDQTITTFITKMDALRLAKWNDILCKMGRGTVDCPHGSAYSAAEAFDDLQEYGRQGTLDAALGDVAQQAGADKTAAQTLNKSIQKIPTLQKGF